MKSLFAEAFGMSKNLSEMTLDMNNNELLESIEIVYDLF